MCINPNKVVDVGFVACRECWQCRERKVDDWVGRNIAESKTAKAAHVVTLTYGEDHSTGGIDHIRSAVLTYSDVQKFLKLLRFHGYPVRYFVVGEYGSKKGRAHWHIILYWQGRVPDVPLRKNFMFEHWEHGWTYWDKMTPEAIRYACKYLVKDNQDGSAQAFGPMPSKKPPLGDAYFRQLARQYAQAGLSPQDLFYSFPDVRRVPYGTRGKTAKAFHDSAKPVRFLMSGKTAENYIRYFLAEWERFHGDAPPKSEIVWDFYARGLDVTAGQRAAYAIDYPWRPDNTFMGLVPVPHLKPKGWSDPVFDPMVNAYVTVCPTFGQRMLFTKLEDGYPKWHVKGNPTALPLEALKKPVEPNMYKAVS